MAGRYKPYPEYKDSGVQWMGEIPSHWEVIQSRRLFSQRKERARPEDEQLTASQKHGVMLQKEYMALESQRVVQVILGSDILKHVEPNDFIISMRSFQGGLEWCKYSGSVSSAYIGIIAVKHVVPAFFSYLFKCQSYIQALQRTSNLVRDGQALRFENFSQVDLLHIADDEQRRIANFLDHETAKIDTLIEKQQQLIQLLKEKRQAVISHAVTKGLSSLNGGPSTKMRDSGIEWLGEVPEHWEIIPLKYLCTFSGGGTPSKENLSYWTDGDIPWVSPKDMKSFWLSNTQDKITEKAVTESSANLVESGALLMVVRSGILQRTIPIAINSVRVTLNQDMKALRFNSRMNSEYAANFILGCEQSLLLEWSKEGATVESIEYEYLSNGLFPVPPIKEQVLINKKILDRMKIFQSLENNAARGIALLQERRTALISAVVTGKIDVRDWVAPQVSPPHKEVVA